MFQGKSISIGFNHKVKLLVIAILVPIALSFSLAIGRYPINLFNLDSTALGILFDIRLPRVIMCIIAGAVLGACGAALQSIFRNPLVSPYILGIEQGAAFGTALALFLLPPIPYIIILSSFTFAIAALLLTLLIAGIYRMTSPLTLVLAGVVVGAIFTAALSIIQYLIDPWRLQGIVFWLMGGFYKATWDKYSIALPGALIGLLILMLMRWRLNILSLGDEEAKSLGVNVILERVIVFVACALAIASITSVVGIIAFIGLILPHIARALFGSDNRVLIPTSAIIGSLIILVTDDLCRSLYSFEIPISIVTTLITAPYFTYLLRKISGEWK